MNDRARPLLSAGLALGVGMGGFIDGILFHQILQIHNMLSARIPNTDLIGAKVNMVWDGFFHAGVWAITFAGILLLWRAGRADAANLSGRLLMGALRWAGVYSIQWKVWSITTCFNFIMFMRLRAFRSGTICFCFGAPSCCSAVGSSLTMN